MLSELTRTASVEGDGDKAASSLAPTKYWDASYARLDLAYRPEDLPFKDLFVAYLPHGGTCFEVGCYPGNFLLYLGLEFGYVVNGIDTTPRVAELEDYFRQHGAAVGSVERGDFFTATLGEYDVVCSFGFIEHFADVETVLAKHAALVSEGGMLVISAPNFRRGQYLLHRLFDAENLRRHSLAAMDLDRWQRALMREGFDVVYAGFWGTADFWTDSPSASRLQRSIAYRIGRAARWVGRHVDHPNSFLSPHMVCIARKRSVTVAALEQ